MQLLLISQSHEIRCLKVSVSKLNAEINQRMSNLENNLKHEVCFVKPEVKLVEGTLRSVLNSRVVLNLGVGHLPYPRLIGVTFNMQTQAEPYFIGQFYTKP